MICAYVFFILIVLKIIINCYYIYLTIKNTNNNIIKIINYKNFKRLKFYLTKVFSITTFSIVKKNTLIIITQL